VVRPSNHLASLGGSHVKISQRAADELKQVRVAMNVMGTPMALAGMGMIAGGIANGVYQMGLFGMMMIGMGLFIGLVLPLVLEWWLTLKVVPALAED